jgi:hypothetical protein
MGKWDEVLEELPKSFGEEPARQVKIDSIKQQIKQENSVFPQTFADLVREYAEVRRRLAKAEAEAYKIGLERSAYEQLLADQADKDETSRMVLNNGDAVTVFWEPRAKVIHKEQFRLWCVANGYEQQLQLMWSTTNSIIKERLMAGEDDPDGVVAEAVLKVRFSQGEEAKQL